MPIWSLLVDRRDLSSLQPKMKLLNLELRYRSLFISYFNSELNLISQTCSCDSKLIPILTVVLLLFAQGQKCKLYTEKKYIIYLNLYFRHQVNVTPAQPFNRFLMFPTFVCQFLQKRFSWQLLEILSPMLSLLFWDHPA